MSRQSYFLALSLMNSRCPAWSLMAADRFIKKELGAGI
jgi:hypothetical protein